MMPRKKTARPSGPRNTTEGRSGANLISATVNPRPSGHENSGVDDDTTNEASPMGDASEQEEQCSPSLINVELDDIALPSYKGKERAVSPNAALEGPEQGPSTNPDTATRPQGRIERFDRSRSNSRSRRPISNADNEDEGTLWNYFASQIRELRSEFDEQLAKSHGALEDLERELQKRKEERRRRRVRRNTSTHHHASDDESGQPTPASCPLHRERE